MMNETYGALCTLSAIGDTQRPLHQVAQQSGAVVESLCRHLLLGVAVPGPDMAAPEHLRVPHSIRSPGSQASMAGCYHLRCPAACWLLPEIRAVYSCRLSGPCSFAIGFQREAYLQATTAASLPWKVAVEMEPEVSL
jgi:hypothetical protein